MNDESAFPDTPGRIFDVEEISVGVYRARGVDEKGRRVESTGTDPDALLNYCREYAKQMLG